MSVRKTTKIPTFAIYDRRLSQEAFRLFCFLRMADDYKTVGIGFDKISEATGLSFDAIYKATDQLREIGYLQATEIDK